MHTVKKQHNKKLTGWAYARPVENLFAAIQDRMRT